jgi:membrane protease subunit HflK
VITTGKSEIQASIKDKILNRLEKEDLGITLVSITIQDAEPPTRAVQEAFKAVETAKQDAETATNNANKYANEVLPAAKADADEILQSAEAYKTARINAANGQASRFAQLYQEYAKYPEITKQRLFYESISAIFPDMKVIIMGKDGNTVQAVLPIDSFVAPDTANDAEGGN